MLRHPLPILRKISSGPIFMAAPARVLGGTFPRRSLDHARVRMGVSVITEVTSFRRFQPEHCWATPPNF